MTAIPYREPLQPRRDGLIIASVIFISACLPLLYLWNRAQQSLFAEIRSSLLATAEAYALLVDGDLHQTLTHPDHEATPGYQEEVERLRRFMTKNPRIAYVYTTILDDQGRVRFILDSALPGDADGDGVDDHSYIMEIYESPTTELKLALREMTSRVESRPYPDKWGMFISGYAPVYNRAWEPVAILGVDIRAEDLVLSLDAIRHSTLAGMGLAFLIAATAGMVIWKARTNTLQSQRRARIAEEKKLEAELRYRHLFEQTPIGVMYYSTEMKIVDCNRQFSELCRMELSSVVGKSIADCLDEGIPDILHKALQGDAQTFRGPCRFPFSGRDQVLWVDIHGVPAVDTRGAIVGGIATWQDITTQYKNEAMSQAEKELLDLITQGATQENILAGLVHSIEKLMPGSLCSILLLDPEKKRLSGGVAPSLPEAYNQAIVGLEIGPEQGSCGTAAYTKKRVIVSDIQTHPLWQEFRELAATHGLRACWSMPILSSKGEILGTFAIYYRNVREPTPDELALLDRAGYLAGIAMERAVFEQDLARERNLLRTLIDNIPDVVFIKDRQHRYMAANHAAARFLGVEDIAMLIDKSDADFLPAPTAAAVHQMEERVLEGHRDVEQESTLVQPDGRTTHLAFSRMPLRNPDGDVIGLITIGRDVTDRRYVEEERIKTQKLESLGILAGGIAHDFNNILTSILGNISMIKSTEERLGTESTELIKDAEVAVARARELTQQLLTFAKGGQPIKKPTNVAEVIREAASLAIRGSTSRLNLELASNLWLADIDAGQIGQAIQNLVLNAEQAMPDGGNIGIIAVNHDLPAGNPYQLAEGPYLVITVEDTGPGIPEELIEKIFDPYFTTKPDGTGLGLTSTFSIIKKHGGTIFADSDLGRGAVFSFLIPALPRACLDETKSAAIPTEPKHARILMMDDEEPILKIGEKMLTRAGYDVETARSGLEAIGKFRAAHDRGEPIDLVILDLTIPGGMGGKDTFVELKKIDANLKAIVSSGYSMDDIMSRHEYFGFSGVITKPYHREDLLAAIASALADGEIQS